MRVLGLDPGLTTTGYGIVERAGGRIRLLAAGALRTSTEAAPAERLADLRTGVLALIGEHKPAAVATERLFFNRNARTAISVGQASGVLTAAASEAGLSVTEYGPLEVKKAVTGVGSAPKSQVQAMVAAVLGLSTAPKPADAADACALAICHLQSAGLSQALSKAVNR
ncbi:MAG TPA: crossover junction endodeoxyribonuclease RuvC [Actinomycetota bacterium]|nr:crossover junction endodeoxyribonuclease RuvC [Actinomycetota bacterium]